MTTMADRLLAAMKESASRQYGREVVTELAHALQCADLAEAGGADEELALASLLHDVGRFAVGPDEISDTLEQVAARAAAGARGHHEAGADLVVPYVPARVAFLVRAHVDAKRYLCATDAAYHESLSRASKRTLTLQGGVMEAEEARRVEQHPWWADAVRLRRWDDAAKVVGKKTRPLSAWKPLLEKYFSAAHAAS
jgi:predicted HD phosphohydrolase